MQQQAEDLVAKEKCNQTLKLQLKLLEEAQSVEVITTTEHQRAPRMNLVDPEEKRRRKLDLNKDASKRYREKQKRKLQQ